MTMKAPSSVIRGQQLRVAHLAARPHFVTRSRILSTKVAASVKFDYDTKVFKKELVKFADTEEYIYR